jgi:hypothetical protein
VGCKYSAEAMTWRSISFLDRAASSIRTRSGRVHPHLNAFIFRAPSSGRPRTMPRSPPCRSIAPHTVAEGIEKPTQRDILSVGLPYGQGYLFFRPIDATEAFTWLTPTPTRRRIIRTAARVSRDEHS